MTDKPIRYKPIFIQNDIYKTIIFPWPAIIVDQNRISHHLKNIQWLAKDFGGILNSEKTEWLFKFDQEEYNCALRYLNNFKFEWNKKHD